MVPSRDKEPVIFKRLRSTIHRTIIVKNSQKTNGFEGEGERGARSQAEPGGVAKHRKQRNPLVMIAII